MNLNLILSKHQMLSRLSKHRFSLTLAAGLLLGALIAGFFQPWSETWLRLASPTVNADHTEQGAGLRLYQGKAFTGVLQAQHANGQVALREYYRAGLRQGSSKRWADNGQLIEVRRYEAGNKSGRHQGWWPHGGKRFEMQFERSVLQGRVEYWHANGRMAALHHFVDGQESGPQRSWRMDGTSLAAYDMMDGRRYGVIDSTPCPTQPGSAAAKQANLAVIAGRSYDAALTSAETVQVQDTIKSIAFSANSMPGNSQNSLENRAKLPYYTDASFAPRWLSESPAAVHAFKSFSLLNQAAQPVNERQLQGGITVVNFFFAGCTTVCPASMAFLRELQLEIRDSIKQAGVKQAGVVHTQPRFWAISIDPLSDTPQSLQTFAERMALSDWQLLTGSPEQVEQIATQSFFAQSRLQAHTERAYLLDGQGRIRGIYNATQRGDLLRLRQDIQQLGT
jgi:protein SCO1